MPRPREQRNPGTLQAAVRRAVRLHTAGRIDAAVAAYRAILKRHPRGCDCWCNLGAALRALGRNDEGLDALRRGIGICPDHVGLNHNLGNALADAGDHEGALARFGAALARDPAHLGAAESCGRALFRLERFEAAVEHCRRALRRHPDSAALHCTLGVALSKLRRLEPAAASLRRAVALAPASADYRLDLYSGPLAGLARYAEGERLLRVAERRHADSPDVLTALGHALICQGRLDEGRRYCDAALARDPGHLRARVNRARANFLAGRYAAAWPDYAWPLLRHRLWGAPRLTGRLWAGQDLAGQSILLCGEQGLGDVIQFARYAPLVARRGARVVLCCQPALAALLRRLPGVAEVVPQDRPRPRTDWVCPLMDVPAVWRTDLDSIPGACPYLSASGPTGARLGPPRRFRVGIVWAGNPDNEHDAQRSCRLDDFAPLVELPGVELVSFQVGPRARELRASGWRWLIREAGEALVPFEATADALAEVDLVITVDTALAHLAGALGRPVWTLLAFAPDWRWMLGRDDTPWYPTMRLFRQPAPNDWAGVFRAVRRELAARLAQARAD